MRYLNDFESYENFESFYRGLSKYVDVDILEYNKDILKDFSKIEILRFP